MLYWLVEILTKEEKKGRKFNIDRTEIIYGKERSNA